MSEPRPVITAWQQEAVASVDVKEGLSIQEMRETWDDFIVRHHGHVRQAETHEVRELVTPRGVPVKLYLPTPDSEGGSLHIHLHGGGFWMGSSRTVDPMSRELAAGLGMAVASVDYGLAPEAPWPAGAEDAYEALVWLSESFERISIGGESAGANLACVVALMARDRGGPALVAQWLDVPLVDFAMTTDESVTRYGSGYGVEVSQFAQMSEWYAGDVEHPYVSPARANLVGLPPTIVTTAECDPLRDQGEAFARALAAAGVPVDCRRAEGHIHGSSWLTAIDDDTARWHDSLVATLARHHEFDELEMTS